MVSSTTIEKMKAPPLEILRFLREHHVMTLAVSNDDIPYTASVFYVFDSAHGDFIYHTDRATRHGYESLVNERAAAGIHFETREVDQIKGVQVTGIVGEVDETDADRERLRDMYLNDFPAARGRDVVLWRFRAQYIKLTDNSVRFGHKIIWERGD